MAALIRVSLISRCLQTPTLRNVPSSQLLENSPVSLSVFHRERRSFLSTGNVLSWKASRKAQVGRRALRAIAEASFQSEAAKPQVSGLSTEPAMPQFSGLPTEVARHQVRSFSSEVSYSDHRIGVTEFVKRFVVWALARAIVGVMASGQKLATGILSFFSPLNEVEMKEWSNLRKGRDGFLLASSPLLFASASGAVAPSTPLTVIASGMSKWLELYSGLLFVRVLLTWFPNIDWERQPMMAIRDMSDPYLNLFRNIMPPFYNMIDLSPILGFFILGIMISLLNSTVT